MCGINSDGFVWLAPLILLLIRLLLIDLRYFTGIIIANKFLGCYFS